MLKQVSPLNALHRAKNIFVHSGFDKLHAQQKSYEETLEKVTRDKFQYLALERNFKSQKWSKGGDRRKRILLSHFQLDNALARSENLCQTEQAKEKIAFLAANLLHKNLKIAQEYETAKKLASDLSEKLQVAEKRFKALNNNYASRKKNYVYCVITTNDNSTKTSPLTKNELTAIIADALMGEPYAVQLVARFGDDNLEIEKDWENLAISAKIPHHYAINQRKKFVKCRIYEGRLFLV